jgi:hypothetical protein
LPFSAPGRIEARSLRPDVDESFLERLLRDLAIRRDAEGKGQSLGTDVGYQVAEGIAVAAGDQSEDIGAHGSSLAAGECPGRDRC